MSGKGTEDFCRWVCSVATGSEAGKPPTLPKLVLKCWSLRATYAIGHCLAQSKRRRGLDRRALRQGRAKDEDLESCAAGSGAIIGRGRNLT